MGVCMDCGCASVSQQGIAGGVVSTVLAYSSDLFWMLLGQPYMSEPQTDLVAVVFSPSKAFWFNRNGNNYEPKFGGKTELSFDSSACEFRFVDCQGEQTIFTNSGDFKQTIDPAGNTTNVNFSSPGVIGEIFQTFFQNGKETKKSNKYEYYTSGPKAGKVKQVATSTSRSPAVELRRMVYDYYVDGDEFGSDGDLKTATEQILQGTTWVDHETSYYRYYLDGDPNGFEHGMKFALGPQAFVRLREDPQVSDPFTAPDSKVAEYADNYYEYDGNHKVSKSVTQAGLLTYTFAYQTSAHADDYNNWKLKVTMTRPDGSQLITYSNYIQATLLTDFVSGSDHWTNYYEYDADARQILHAHPSAVVSYDDGQADLDVTLRSSAGLLEITDYYASTTATPTTPGGVEGYVQFTKVQQGTSGSPIKQSETTYFERTAGAVTIYPVAESTVFRHDDGTGGITTSFAYTWFTDTVQVEQRTTTLPVVPTIQNGTGVAATTTQIYDQYGNVQWLRDERGFITYRDYDWALGVMTEQIQDVDGTKLTLPSGWVTPVGGGLHLITDYDYDLLGRDLEKLGPAHEVLGQTVRAASWTAYRDLEDEIYSGQGYALGATGPYQYTLTNPVSIQRMSDNGLRSDSITAVRGCDGSGTCGCKSSCGCALPEAGVVESAGKLSASDCFPQSSWVRWSTSFSNKHGQMTASRTYHLIPASGIGAFGVNYDETTFGYDELNRQNRTVSPTGTINRTVYDVRGQVVSSWTGTNDNLSTASDPTGGGAPGNNMVQTSAMQYDGGSDGGDGNLTQQTAYVDGSTTRVTSFEYDFRNRRIVTDGEIDFYQTTEYDNLSQTIRVDRRNTTPAAT
jgi:hypothetical protein